MGLFERIFGEKVKTPTATKSQYKALTAYQPMFRSFSGQIYEQELVRASIHATAVQVAKLKVEFYGHGSADLAQRLKRPNIFQTWYQFMYRTATILETDNTVFIVPAFDKFGRITEVYPIVPAYTEMVEVKGSPWLAFQFPSGKTVQMPVWQVGILSKFQYKNDFFGEDNLALNPTMDLIEIQNQGITEGVKSAATYRFMAQYNNLAFDDDLDAEQDRFNTRASKGGGMALLFPKNYENIKQIESKPFVIDAEQMAQIKNNVFDYFGTNEEILQGKCYGDKWTAFYESKIEPIAIQFSEVMTYLLWINGQIAKEAGVIATANRLQYMSNNEKLNVSAQLADRGILNRDEVREIWNLPPLPDGQGQEYIIRGEYWNASEKINEGEKNDE